MIIEPQPSADAALAIAIVMEENACGEREAAVLIHERCRALGVSPDETAATIITIAANSQQRPTA